MESSEISSGWMSRISELKSERSICDARLKDLMPQGNAGVITLYMLPGSLCLPSINGVFEQFHNYLES